MLVDAIGWTGAALVLLAYALLCWNKVSSTSSAYQWLNIAGAIGLMINGWLRGAYPSVGLNIIWAGIGLYVLSRARRAR